MQPGDRFERYTVEGLLGRGGMGCVYKAHDPKLGRDVAIKVLLPKGSAAADATPSEESKARIMREARAAAALSHPNAVSIYDVGESETAGPYIVMELVQGQSLGDAMRAPSTTVRDKVRWLTETASALAAAHDRGIVHRDVKPDNVLVRSDGVAKVLDFGIARRSASTADPSAPTQTPLPTLTELGAQIGTPLYMAPEQIKGNPIDGRTDQFAWGVVAYEALTGKLPWRLDKGQLGVAASILTDTPPPMVDVPPEVETIVRRALSKAPDDRFPSMRELISELGAPSSEAGARQSTPEPVPSARAEASVASATSGRAPSSGSAKDARKYDTQEFKEIFQRALERQEAEGKYGRDDLAAAAREMGIRDDVLAATLADEDAAEAASKKADVERRATEGADRGREMRKLMRMAVTFAIVNFVCYFALHLHTAWVLYGTLIAFAFQLRNVWFPSEHGGRESRRERRQRRREERREGRRASGAPPVTADTDARIEDGVRELLGTTAKRVGRVRIAGAGAGAGKAGPPASRSEVEREAEEEALAADEQREAEKRRS